MIGDSQLFTVDASRCSSCASSFGLGCPATFPAHPSCSFGPCRAISLATHLILVCFSLILFYLHLHDCSFVKDIKMLPTVKIAACHASPIFLDAEKTTEKALRLIDEAAAQGAHLIAFPESFIPGFPIWAGTGAPVDNPGLFARFVEASIYADGPEIAQIQSRCAERKVVVSIGFSERSRHSVGCLWNSNIVIGENGKVLAHHRKMCPTYWEKLIWSNGDGYGLRVCDTASAGKVGALICGENTNPLARYAMMAQGEQVHVACFPPTWPTKRKAGYQNRKLSRSFKRLISKSWRWLSLC